MCTHRPASPRPRPRSRATPSRIARAVDRRGIRPGCDRIDPAVASPTVGSCCSWRNWCSYRASRGLQQYSCARSTWADDGVFELRAADWRRVPVVDTAAGQCWWCWWWWMMTYIDRMTNSTDAIILTYVSLCKIYYCSCWVIYKQRRLHTFLRSLSVLHTFVLCLHNTHACVHLWHSVTAQRYYPLPWLQLFWTMTDVGSSVVLSVCESVRQNGPM